MSPDNTHKLIGFYMEVLILGANTMYMLFCFFKLFLIGCIGLRNGCFFHLLVEKLEKIRRTYFGHKAFRGCWICMDYFPCYFGCNNFAASPFVLVQTERMNNIKAAIFESISMVISAGCNCSFPEAAFQKKQNPVFCSVAL